MSNRTPDASALKNCSKKTEALKSINFIKNIPITKWTSRVETTPDYDGHMAELETVKNGRKEYYGKGGYRK